MTNLEAPVTYDELLSRKAVKAPKVGMADVPELGGHLFPHQRDTVDFLLKAGRGAAFLDTGMGKTACELEYGRVVVEETNRPVLMLAPLAVGKQHQREADRFGVDAMVIRDPSEIDGARIYITNYERIHLFDRSLFAGLILDESSIVKSFTGKTSRALIEFGEDMRWKLAATATPAPNDHMELGQHSMFVGAMSSSEMLARWFIADQTEMGRYRLKRHGIKPFWSWVASWARCVGKPSDLGYSDAGFDLPDLEIIKHIVETDMTQGADGMLFRIPDTSATSIHKEKRITSAARAEKIASLVNAEPDEDWVIWVETDYDADSIMALLPNAIEVRGSDSSEHKEMAVEWFCGLGDYGFEFPSKAKKCQTKTTSKTTTGKIETSDSKNQNSGQSQTKITAETICESTQEQTQINSEKRLSSELNTTGNVGKNTPPISNIGKEKNGKFPNTSETTLKNDSQTESKSTESRLKTTEGSSPNKAAFAQSADQLTPGAQSESGFILTIATPPELSEGFCAQTAIKALANSKTIRSYSNGQPRTSGKILVSKPSIFGFGLNLQHCARTAFVGLSFSYEMFYQAIRRFWRFGQKRPVMCHIALAETETAIWNTIQRKKADHEKMKIEMFEAMRREVITKVVKQAYEPRMVASLPAWLN